MADDIRKKLADSMRMAWMIRGAVDSAREQLFFALNIIDAIDDDFDDKIEQSVQRALLKVKKASIILDLLEEGRRKGWEKTGRFGCLEHGGD